MGKQPSPGVNRIHPSAGFTLIELLIVVSILGLLAGLLLPALSFAKKSADASVCLANLNGSGKAMIAYATSNNGYYPGPNTTGKSMTSSYQFSNLSAGEPTQNVDWITPTLGEALGLGKDRKQKIETIFNTKLCCPANAECYASEYGSPPLFAGKIGNLRVVSYSSPIALHIRSGGKKDPVAPNSTPSCSTVDITKSGHSPSLQALSNPSEKIWAMDGARYVDTNNLCTFNAFPYQNDGGNFMVTGPALISTNVKGDPYSINKATLKPTATGTRFAFRHKEALNAVFFDGHAEKLPVEKAVQVHYYFPTASIIKNAADTYDPKDKTNDRIR